jgi:hypothetical protein
MVDMRKAELTVLTVHLPTYILACLLKTNILIVMRAF